MNTNKKTQSRHYARQYAMKALYQWHFSKASPVELIDYVKQERDMSVVDIPYFEALVQDTLTHRKAIDEQLAAVINRALSSINPVELSIVRVAVCELLYRLEIPYRVVINEALELTKTFGAKEGYRFVNGVLDAVAKAVRATERR